MPKNTIYHLNFIVLIIKRLLKKSRGKVNADEFLRLRSKYDNQDLVDQIQSVFLEKHYCWSTRRIAKLQVLSMPPVKHYDISNSVILTNCDRNTTRVLKTVNLSKKTR